MFALGNSCHQRRMVDLFVVASLTPCAVIGCFPTLEQFKSLQLHRPFIAQLSGITGQPRLAARNAIFFLVIVSP
jgi:hypothetical protein